MTDVECERIHSSNVYGTIVESFQKEIFDLKTRISHLEAQMSCLKGQHEEWSYFENQLVRSTKSNITIKYKICKTCGRYEEISRTKDD